MMKIVGLEGSQVFLEDGGSEHQFVMIVRKNGKDYTVPIVIETYQFLSEIGSLIGDGHFEGKAAEVALFQGNKISAEQDEVNAKEAPAPSPVPPLDKQQELVGTLEKKPSKDETNALEFMSKIGVFGKPEDVLKAMRSAEGMEDGPDALEGFEDIDEEDDPGEENSTEQW
jgi:hypothetical protein